MIEIETGVFFDPSQQYLHEQPQAVQELPFVAETWEEVDLENIRVLTSVWQNLAYKLTITCQYVHPLSNAGWAAFSDNPIITLTLL